MTINDIDNIVSELSVFGQIDGQNISGTFTEDLSIPGSGTAAVSYTHLTLPTKA